MRGCSGDDLLKLSVRLHGIELGRPVDLVVDLDARRAVGLELLCGDRARRFLPLAAASVESDEIAVDSALAVSDDLAYYLARGRGLRMLRGAAVARDGVEVGRLADVVLDSEGAIAELVLDGDRRVELTPRVTISPLTASRSAA